MSDQIVICVKQLVTAFVEFSITWFSEFYVEISAEIPMM